MENNEFITSLSEVKAGDLGEKKRRKVPINSIVRIAVLIVCLGALCYSLYYVSLSVIDYFRANNTYDDINRAFFANSVEPMYAQAKCATTPNYEVCQNIDPNEIENPVIREIDRDYEKKRSELYALKLKYPELYGWITIPGTCIDYPLMQTNDNQYYLTHSYTGAHLLGGAIFADYRNSKSVTQNNNFIVYGHHMSARLQFHDLDKYLSESFFKQYNKIYIYTLEGKYTYEVISVYNTLATYNYIKTQFVSADDFASYANTMIANSIYDTGTVFTANDKMITLSTCTNRSDNNKDGRLCVEGILVDIYE